MLLVVDVVLCGRMQSQGDCLGQESPGERGASEEIREGQCSFYTLLWSFKWTLLRNLSRNFGLLKH